MRANNRVQPDDYIRLFVHYATSLLSLCRRIWRYWTSKIFVRYTVSAYPFSLPISLMMIVRIRVLYLITIIKSEVWPICHCLGMGRETMVCPICLAIFLWTLTSKLGTTSTNCKAFSSRNARKSQVETLCLMKNSAKDYHPNLGASQPKARNMIKSNMHDKKSEASSLVN